MERRKILLLCLVLFAQQASAFLPEAEDRARAEEKAISSISLKALEDMVEKDDNIRRIRNEKLSFLLDPKYEEGVGPSRRAFESSSSRPEKFFGGMPFDAIMAASERIAEASNHVYLFDQYAPENEFLDNFDDLKDSFRNDNEFSASETFFTHSDAEDADDDKLTKGRSPLSQKEPKKERNCKTVVKKVMDEDDARQHPDKPTRVKSVIISKECEYPEDSQSEFDPSISPLTERRYVPRRMKLSLDLDESPSKSTEDDEAYDSHSNARNDRVLRNPLHSDYIDRMFETHFSQMRNFKSPLSFPKEIRERKTKVHDRTEEPQLKAPQRTYSYKYPEEDKLSFDLNNNDNYNRKKLEVSKRLNNPRVYYQGDSSPKARKTPEDKSNLKLSVDSDSEEETKQKSTADNSTPKVTKKTFAYYRKDNPKDDPNNQEYAEEYHQGNYRSFSTDYDSDRDGPK